MSEMELLENLAFKIKTLKVNDNSLIVAVCGAADLGKTYLSAKLTDIFCQMGINAKYLTLDSYLMSRLERINKRLSGYQPESYDLSTALTDLKRFKCGQTIEYFPYDHIEGGRTSRKEIINPCDILLLDGLHSMNYLFTPFVNFSIFVCTSDEMLVEIRHRADITKRKQSEEFSKKNMATEFEKYKKFVAPYKNMANVILFLKEQWNYILTENE